MSRPTIDPLLQCKTLSSTVEPQKLIWLSAHQCYSAEPISTCRFTEEKAGEAVVNSLLKGGKGHWSPLEQAHISFSMSFVPHSLMQQLTRHRLLSFSVQSFRYTSLNVEDIEKAVYIRQEGTYTSRDGSYVYSAKQRASDLHRATEQVLLYNKAIEGGMPPEQARGLLPFDVRQHLVAGGNLRAWLHVLDLRLKADAQPEIQQLSTQIEDLLTTWCPQILEWYSNNRRGKALLSP
jgi:thymidylate synthase (FAD)